MTAQAASVNCWAATNPGWDTGGSGGGLRMIRRKLSRPRPAGLVKGLEDRLIDIEVHVQRGDVGAGQTGAHKWPRSSYRPANTPA
jgi:hypothetical protein